MNKIKESTLFFRTILLFTMAMTFAILDLTILPSALLHNISADPPANQVFLTLDNAHFASTTSNQTHQIKVRVNYTVSDPSIVNQTINALMRVYILNGTLIKTSSFKGGFTANSSGTETLATNLENKVQNVTAVVQFTNADKTMPISNELKVKINFGQAIRG
ncbi:MAG: hypothetical protein WA421_10115 [Nitrososphaeraceae archaeon]|jgi:hypothetical protein